MTLPLRGLGLAAVALLAGCGGRREAPTVMLTRPADTVITAYAEAPEAVWLGGQRWAVVSPSDSTVGLVDFTDRRLTPLAGARSAAEFRSPFSIFTLDRDTLYIGDWARRRLTTWTVDGRLVDSLGPPPLTRGTLPTARDAAGHWYAARPPAPGPRGAGNRDSALVLRLSPDLQQADTVAQLSPLDVAEVQGNGGRQYERRVFSGNDVWDALADGSVWIARVNQNRVDWIRPDGSVVKGEALPDRVLEVTREDRELFAQRFPPELRNHAEQLPFAIVKPPFVEGFTGPDGHVWLEKSRSVTDTVRRYQEVDREGRLIRELHLPGWGRILAVGAGRGLVAEPFKEGVRLLEVAIPPADTTTPGS